MENLDGALGFRATLDIDDFSVSTQAMERHIKHFSQIACEEMDSVDEAILRMSQKAAQYISYYLVGQGMHNLVNSIIQTRGQFQQLEIAFGTMLGSEQKAAEVMKQIVDTAAKTPLNLIEVANGAKQLMAYGVSAEKVNDTLVRLGNVASALSIPLNDLVYLYGTTMVQGRLYANDVRQFTGRGIPLVKELAEMYHKNTDEISAMVAAGKIGFNDVEAVINKMTDSGGQFYNLMEKQSASLTGQIANLQDAWDMLLNSWGQEGEGVFSAFIQGATYMVENADTILRYLKSIAIAYGSIRAAIILNNIATKGYTGVALLDNIVRNGKLALMKAEDAISGKTHAKTQAMTQSELAYARAIENSMTQEERDAFVKQQRIAAISSLLTAQQREYLSNVGLTASSGGYEAAAIGVMSAEQRLSLSKLDLTTNSTAYRAAIVQNTKAELDNVTAMVAQLETEKRIAIERVEAQKLKLLATRENINALSMEMNVAGANCDVARAATLQKKIEAAQDKAATIQKELLVLESTRLSKTKALEAAQTRQSALASSIDTAQKKAQTASTNILSVATGKLTDAIKTLWATLRANPLGAVLSIIGAVWSAISMFSEETEKATTETDDFEEATRDVVKRLDIYFEILSKCESTGKTYKDMIGKINEICQEYNTTLLDENSTLREQKKLYLDVRDAVQAATAEKIKAKYRKEELKELAGHSDDNYKFFQIRLNNLTYKTTEPDNPYGIYINSTPYDREMTEPAERIRRAAPEVREAIRSMVESGAEELAKLSPEEFSKRYEEIVRQISTATKTTTFATTKEMAAFNVSLKVYLDNQLRDVKKSNEVLARMEERINKMFSVKDEGENKDTLDYAKMSFQDLDKLMLETQDEIDTINAKKVKVDTDNAKLKELLEKLKEVKGAISAKETNLNTEEGISNRIKQLKEEKATTDMTTARYKELGKEIAALEKRLPQKNNTNSKADTTHKDYLKKQKDAEYKLEEARIAIMEEGVEKRTALMELEHKKRMDAIKTEREEYEKTKQKAGKGGLSADEAQGFDKRLEAEETQHQRNLQKTFEGELDYKKKQYTLYWRWVENVGKGVADEQFASLLQSGSSYKAYIEKQIADLKQKQKEGKKLTEGENNFLISLNVQYDELNGAKSALDRFRDSVSKSINQSATLAEKLKAIAKAKKELQDGKSGIVGEADRATAMVGLTEQEAGIQQEVEQKVLKDYRSFEEQRKSIQEEYALLRAEAERMGDKERVRLINQGENEALSSLNASMLMQSESWKNLFSDLDALTVKEIDKLITDIQTKMSTADLKLNTADLKTVLDRLDEARQKVLDTNPFKAMGKAISEVFKTSQNGAKKSSKQIKTDWKNLASATEGCFDFVNDAVDNCSVLKDLVGDTGKETIKMLQGMAMAGIAMATAISTAEKGSVILTAISIALQAISWIATLFNDDAKHEENIKNLQRNIDALERSCDRLKAAFDRTYWVFSDEERAAYEERIQHIKDLISEQAQLANKAVFAWDFDGYARAIAKIKELQRELSKAKTNGDIFTIYEAEREALIAQQKLIEKQIKEEQQKKKVDEDKIIEWQNAIEDIDDQLAEMERNMIETFAGTTTKEAIDQYADAIVDAYCAGEDAAKALGDTTREVLKKAVIDALKRQFLAKAMDDAVKFLGDAMSDGVLTKEEKEEFENLTKRAGETFTNALEAVGDWIKDAEAIEDPLSGAVKSMSEETAGVIAGRLNAFIINQGQQTDVLRQQLLMQSDIARNTKATTDILNTISATLMRIETKDNSLLSQGIQ